MIASLRSLVCILICCAVFASRRRASTIRWRSFQQDKFSETAKAISELAASGAPNASAILDALGDNRLLIDTGAHHLLVYKTTSGDIVNARTNEKLSGVDAERFQESARQQCAAQRRSTRRSVR